MRCTITIICLLLSCVSVMANSLSDTEAEHLRDEVVEVTRAVELGDADRLIESTHTSLITLAGGADAYAQVARGAVKHLVESGVQFLSSEVGTPTRTYAAGDEEVCFVPRVSIFQIEEKKAKSTTFMVAIRKVGTVKWAFLDGAGLRKRPEMLYTLLPKLDRSVALPPNTIEIL